MKAILSTAALIALTGCTSLGKSEFECPRTEVGAACISARQAYERTHVADRVQPNYIDGKKIEDKGPDGESQAQSAPAGSAYRPPLPEIDSPLPIRTQAKVMRIRVFPWEDNARDLNTGGFVFTEVEGRMWTLGEDQISRVQANVINPLAAPARSAIQSPAGAPSSVNQPISTPRQAQQVPVTAGRPGAPAGAPNPIAQ